MEDAEESLSVDLESLSGAQLAGRFRLGRMLGRGGYGAVFEAEQTSVGRRCAVKVLVPHVAADPRNTQRFEREARLTSQLAHPNTVVIYDFGLDPTNKVLFLAMEHIEGESLRDRIRVQGTLSLDTTLHIVHQAARSLQDAHERGLVHRDVKPHNIMVTTRGGDPNFVKVIDFGIAKFLDSEPVRMTLRSVTATGTIIGTPAYMAPEQVRSEALDGRTDQYSLAVCVYQMLTGRTLFAGDSPIDIATKHLSESPLPIRAFHPGLEVNGDFERVLLRALSKEAFDRFPTIREFADELVIASGVALPQAVSTGEALRVVDEVADAPTESLSFEDVHVTAPTAVNSPAIDALADTASSVAPAPPTRDGRFDRTTQPAQVRHPQAAPDSDDLPGGTMIVGGAELVKTAESRPPRNDDRTGPQFVVYAAAATALLVLLAVGAVAVTSKPRPQPVDAEPAAKPAPAPAPAARAPEPVVATPEAAPAVPAAVPTANRARPRANSQDRPKTPEPVPKSERPKPKSEEPKADSQEPAAPHVESGRVTVTLMPWGTLVVDGEEVGEDGRQTIELSAGKHQLELRQDGAVRAIKTVDVEAGQHTMVNLIAR